MTGNRQESTPPAGSTSPFGDTGVAVSPARFSQKELREISFEISARWFSREPAPRLTLSVVHPWRIHAYWIVTQAMMKKALLTAKAPHAMVIRFFDVAPGQIGKSAEQATFDVEVDGLVNNWYIDIWQPGRRYIAELGLRGADNALHVFALSNEIQVPRAEPSPALEFHLATHQGAKPISAAPAVAESAFSVAHLTGLLPPFRGFPDTKPDAISQTLDEPKFPSAPLARVQNWDEEPTVDDGSTSVPERSSYGTEFPVVSIEAVHTPSADVAGREAPIDYAAVPELPETDPGMVSASNMIVTSPSLSVFLAPAQSSTRSTERPAFPEEPQTTSSERAFPEVLTPIAHLDGHDAPSSSSAQAIDDSALAAGAVDTGIHGQEHATPLPQNGVEDADSFPQIEKGKLDAYRREAERFESSLSYGPDHGSPTPPMSSATPDNERIQPFAMSAGASGSPAPAAAEDQSNATCPVPVGAAATTVVPLEEAIAESYFSATPDGRGLDLSVQLELSGISGADRLPTLFGAPVHVDEQGRFSVRIRLDKGPQIATLLRAQRKNISEHR